MFIYLIGIEIFFLGIDLFIVTEFTLTRTEHTEITGDYFWGKNLSKHLNFSAYFRLTKGERSHAHTLLMDRTYVKSARTVFVNLMGHLIIAVTVLRSASQETVLSIWRVGNQ